MNARHRQPLIFTRGRRMYQIAPAYADGQGFVGVCNGRIIATADSPELVVRAILLPSNAGVVAAGMGDPF